MTTEAPDPRRFKSWEDAFQYPIPTIRKFEQQLRSNASDNREKLRSLVGASYRELLGTAERIIEMDEQMQDVDRTLGHVGRKCNARAVEKAIENFASSKRHERAHNFERYALASQLAVLQSCPRVISRSLRKDGSSLLGSKVLVISRLLHKTLSQTSVSETILDKLRNQLGSLRRKLLNHADKQLSRADIEMSVLVENMVAFSLATSSTPTDVLKHFHHVRSEAIANLLDNPSDINSSVVQALKLYVRTLHDTQAIFPRRLAEALARLRDQPLLRDRDFQAVQELKLDIHERWIADDVRKYTPYPRQDDLQKSEADKLLKTWARQAIKAYVEGLSAVLENHSDLQGIVAIRKELFEASNASNIRAPGIKASDILDNLRQVINSTLKEFIKSRTVELSNVFRKVNDVLSHWQADASGATPSLWAGDRISLANSDGAEAFKQAIINLSHGKDASVLSVLDAYDAWAKSVDGVHACIKEIKEARWDDDLSDVDDEDNDDLESMQVLLSEDDPRELEKTLKEALLTSLKSLSIKLGEITSDLRNSPDDNIDKRSRFLLRVIRELQSRLQTISSNSLPAKVLSVPLYEFITVVAKHPAMDVYRQALDRFISARYIPARTLWEGNPPLPVQPSPSSFRLLRTLNASMAEAGADLWTSPAVTVLKKAVKTDIAELINSTLLKNTEGTSTTKESLHVNGVAKLNDADSTADSERAAADKTEIENVAEVQDGDSSEAQNSLRQAKMTQILFDILYLQKALGDSSDDIQAPLASLISQIRDATGVEASGAERLKKSAFDYWKRTYLLFALLA